MYRASAKAELRRFITCDRRHVRHFAQHQGVLRLLRKYADMPMSADACLVRMIEIHRDASVLTLDQDFVAYRRNGRERIPLLAPR